ncbi:hypothetical protein PSEUBRA_002756 [Kalmanozyma brasiliensis GHG001]|uniref:Uncharacterized protein n=1 Tax=Kalmanozyma brasiliensis (strain GHG001) TaxID=1365824 RepID=V5EWE7_KALBG|nr:uncharacterized protein PSEUBRA_002756 [Kalmanozyma brasiliensis GHG001]EST07663.1 hypothetical protein PSEUBRA_002756 [Kalmanozyma brasiliensis GHG001]
MTEHDLSALDGLLADIDIEERGDEDPRAAKLQALFEQAKASYTAKIDIPTWYIASTSSTAPFNIDTFAVPNPSKLLAQRKADRTGSTNQEWTVNYLYTQGYFEKCLSYVTSFALSMGIEFPFGEMEPVIEYDSSQVALRRSKQERELSKNWGIIKDVVDAGVRSLLALLRNGSTSTRIEAWAPNADGKTFSWDKVRLGTLAGGFLPFCMREVRVGAGDTRSGYSGMVVAADQGGLAVDMDKLRVQNWTVTHGLALTVGDLALEVGLYRTAIEAHTLFLAARGQMWRVLLALANELSCYLTSLEGKAKEGSLEALKVVVKASVVSAMQAVPRSRRLDIARSVLVEHRVIPSSWIDKVLVPDHVEASPFQNEDDLLFNGLLQPADAQAKDGPSIVPEEIGIALVKVVFAKKSGLFAMYEKFPTYMREYTQRLAAAAAPDAAWEGDFDAAEEDDTENGPRSVRTL